MNDWEKAIKDMRASEKAIHDKEINEAQIAGYFQCLDDFGIWKDGVQHIGCLQDDIKVIKIMITQRGTIWPPV